MKRFALALSLSVVCFAGRSHAQPRDVQLAMGGSYLWDIAWLGGAAAMGVPSLFLEPPAVNVAPLDGLGGRAWNPGVATASDVVLWGGMGATLALGVAVERWGRDTRGATLLRASLVMGEAAAMTLGVVGLTKNLLGECRPRAWNDATATCDAAVVDDRRSFPSGHTSPLAAMAGASLGMMLFPTGRQRSYWPLVATATTLAASNLVLRVVAGAHNWVDTSTGFALGLSVGLTTAALHTYATPSGVTVSAGPRGVTVAGRF